MSEGSFPPAVRENRWWHLLASAEGFRRLQQDSRVREESTLMAEHLELMWRDGGYRADVLRAVEAHLDGRGNRPLSFEQRHARGFRELVRAWLAPDDHEISGAMGSLLHALVIFFPLALTEVAAPEITTELIEHARSEVHDALKMTAGQTSREKATAVARAVLRAAGVPEQRAHDLYG